MQSASSYSTCCDLFSVVSQDRISSPDECQTEIEKKSECITTQALTKIVTIVQNYESRRAQCAPARQFTGLFIIYVNRDSIARHVHLNGH